MPVTLNLVPVTLNLVPVLLILGPVLLIMGPRNDLPHASIPYGSQKPVSVIIPCKTVKTGSVENTALRPDEEQSPEAACCGDCGVSGRPFRVTSGVYGCAHTGDTSSF